MQKVVETGFGLILFSFRFGNRFEGVSAAVHGVFVVSEVEPAYDAIATGRQSRIVSQ